MIEAHPYRAVLTVLTVMVVCGFTAAMIGQNNDGPWGGLPEWLGAATWFGFLASVLAIVVLSVYLLVAHLRWRKEQETRRERVADALPLPIVDADMAADRSAASSSTSVTR